MANEISLGMARIDLIKGNLVRESTSSLYVSFTGEELQYVVDNNVASFCYLNIQHFFPNGMYKISDEHYDSIERNQNNEIIYTQKIQKLALKNLTFTLNNGIFESNEITDIASNTPILIDYYNVVTGDLSDGYAKIDTRRVKIQDDSCSTVEALETKIANGFVYYVLANSVAKKITPNPDFTFLVENVSGSIQVTSFTMATAPFVGTITYGEAISIKYATNKDLQFVYEDIKNTIEKVDTNLQDQIDVIDATIEANDAIYVKSVNNILPADGNVSITRVHNADVALDLESNDIITNVDTFLFRTSGGTDNIFSGSAYLNAIHGQANIGDETAATIQYDSNSGGTITPEAMPVAEGEDPVEPTPIQIATFTVEVTDTNKWWNFLKVHVYNPDETFIFNYNYPNWVMTLNRPFEENYFLDDNDQAVDHYTCSPQFLLDTLGITVELTSGSSYEYCQFKIIYKPKTYASYQGVVLEKFESVGFNLYNAATQMAHVTGGDSLIFLTPDAVEFYFATSPTATIEEAELITFESKTIGVNVINNTYTPSSNGYIFTVLTGADLPLVNNIRISYIWSGKQLYNTEITTYTKSITDLTHTVNGVQEYLTLNFLNGHYDTLDCRNGKFIQRIGQYNATETSLFLFATTVYLSTGTMLYVDFNTLDEIARDRVNQYNQKAIERHEPIYNIPTIGETSLISDYSINWEYQVDDFGTEEFIIPDTYTSATPMVEMLYGANLIDKLRRSVVTYTKQTGIEVSEQQTAWSNLNLIEVNCYIGLNNVEVVAMDKDDGTGVRLSSVKTSSEDTSVKFTLPHLGHWYFSAKLQTGENIIADIDIEYFGNYTVRLFGKQYGFRRSKNVSDPEGRISYILDAEGMTPVAFDGNDFQVNSWGTFIDEVCEPVTVSHEGIVRSLNKTNQAEYSNSEAIVFETFQDEFMVAFKKYVWVKRYEDQFYEYVIFSDEKIDKDFYNFAHLSSDGNSVSTFYWGMFPANKTIGVAAEPSTHQLHSRPLVGTAAASQGFTIASTLTQYETNANNLLSNNDQSHWHIGYKSAWDYICDLITLITKTDNAQDIFGPGYTGNARVFAGTDTDRNTKLANGGFVKSNSYTDSMRVFWIWDFYGNNNEPLLGFIRKNITTGNNNNATFYYTKMAINLDGSHYGYCPTLAVNTAASEFTDIGFVQTSNFYLQGTSGQYIAQISTSVLGCLPKTTQATANLYIGDTISWGNTNRTTYIPVFGAYTTATANYMQNGPRALNFGSWAYTGTLPTATVWPRLTYV